MLYNALLHTTILRPFFWDHPGDLVPEENFWTLWWYGRLTEADIPTTRLGATPSRLTSRLPPLSPLFYIVNGEENPQKPHLPLGISSPFRRTDHGPT